MKTTLFLSRPLTVLFALITTAVAGCQEPESEPFQPLDVMTDQTVLPPEGKSFAILAGGCFWCTEAIYAEMQGVDKVESGYTGGHIKNPGYREICTGRTGRASCPHHLRSGRGHLRGTLGGVLENP